MRGLVLLLAASCWAQDQAVIPGPGVFGRSNLTTAGAVPYVSATGTLNQDPTAFFWDATNDRLGIGTASPIHRISVTGKVGGATYAGTYVDPSGTNLDMSANANITIVAGASGAGLLTGATGNWSLGVAGLADRNFKLSVQKSGSSGTVEIYDITATTGSTLLSIYAGAGQSTNDITRWYTAAGTKTLWVDYGTAIHGGTYYTLQYGDSKALRFYDAGCVAWSSSNTSDSGSYDTGMCRSAAGITEFNNGTAGTFREVKARHFLTGGTAPTITSGAGTGATIAGSDAAARITFGTSAIETWVIAFGTAWTTAPVCIATPESSGFTISRVAATTSQITIYGSVGPSSTNTAVFQCLGY